MAAVTLYSGEEIDEDEDDYVIFGVITAAEAFADYIMNGVVEIDDDGEADKAPV